MKYLTRIRKDSLGITAVAILLLVGVWISLYQIDGIVHGTLYDYGLEFNTEWANVYWTYKNTIFALTATLTVLMSLALYNAMNKKTMAMVRCELCGEDVVPEPIGDSFKCSNCQQLLE